MFHPFKRHNDNIFQNGILVLVYHSYHQSFSQFFESHIKYLKSHCQIISPNDFYDGITLKREIPERSVLITLDDGFHTDYSIAYPILKKNKVHAISFVITDPYYTEISGKDWWREVGEWIEIGSHTVSHAEIFVSDELTGFIVPVDNQITKMYCMVKGVTYHPGFPLYQRGAELVHRQIILPDGLIRLIQEKVRETGFFEQKDWYKILREVIQHNPFPYQYETDEMKEERISREVFESKMEIEKITEKKCKMFAYPFGAYDEKVIQKVRAAGYEFAFSSSSGLVFPEDDPFTLNRVNVPLERLEDSLEDILNKFFP